MSEHEAALSAWAEISAKLGSSLLSQFYRADEPNQVLVSRTYDEGGNAEFTFVSNVRAWESLDEVIDGLTARETYHRGIAKSTWRRWRKYHHGRLADEMVRLRLELEALR